MSEDQISQKRLKALVQSLEWTYGVVWKLSSRVAAVLLFFVIKHQLEESEGILTLGFLSVGISSGVVEIVLGSDS
jgi:hypothetical protein